MDSERALGRAFVIGDTGAVQRLTAADFVGVAPHGTRYDKDSVLRMIRERPPGTSDDISQVTVRFYGDTAIVQANEHEVGPQRAAVERVFTDTWVKIDGRWQVVAAEDLDPRCGAK